MPGSCLAHAWRMHAWLMPSVKDAGRGGAWCWLRTAVSAEGLASGWAAGLQQVQDTLNLPADK